MLFKDCTFNQNFNFNMTGGAKKIDYFLNASVYNENGIMRKPEASKFDTNINARNTCSSQCLGRRHQDHPRIAEDEHPAALPPRPDPERL